MCDIEVNSDVLKSLNEALYSIAHSDIRPVSEVFEILGGTGGPIMLVDDVDERQSKSENNKITVKTTFNPYVIKQSVLTDIDLHSMINTLANNTVEHVMELREAGVKEALVKLGWAPPTWGKKPLEGIVIVDDIDHAQTPCPDRGGHGCTECDKNCEGAGKPSPTCKDCTNSRSAAALKKLQAKNKKRLDARRNKRMIFKVPAATKYTIHGFNIAPGREMDGGCADCDKSCGRTGNFKKVPCPFFGVMALDREDAERKPKGELPTLTCADCTHQDSEYLVGMGIDNHTNCLKKLTLMQLDREACEHFNDANDFSECGEHGCGTECDKNCEGAGKRETVELTRSECTHIDGCGTSEKFPICSEFIEAQSPTCADCTHQDPMKSIIGSAGVTYCKSKNTHVPLNGEACGEFSSATKDTEASEASGENKLLGRAERGEFCLHTCTASMSEREILNYFGCTSLGGIKGCGDLIATLHAEVTDLRSQKKALKSANQELLELANNCPECEKYCKIADATVEDNSVLRDHNASLLARLEAGLEEVGDTENVIASLYSQVLKENDQLKESNIALETVANIQEDTIDELAKKNDMFSKACSKGGEITNILCDRLHRAEEEYMGQDRIQRMPGTIQELIRMDYRKALKGK